MPDTVAYGYNGNTNGYTNNAAGGAVSGSPANNHLQFSYKSMRDLLNPQRNDGFPNGSYEEHYGNRATAAGLQSSGMAINDLTAPVENISNHNSLDQIPKTGSGVPISNDQRYGSGTNSNTNTFGETIPSTLQELHTAAQAKNATLEPHYQANLSSPSSSSSASSSPSSSPHKQASLLGPALSAETYSVSFSNNESETQSSPATDNKEDGNTSDGKEVFGDIQCMDCCQKFSNNKDLRRHQKAEHDRRTYKCRKCGDLFLTIADRQTHKNNKHFPQIEQEVKQDNFIEFSKGTVLRATRNEKGAFECPSEYCTFTTRIPSYWYDHIRNVDHCSGEDPQKKKRSKKPKPGSN